MFDMMNQAKNAIQALNTALEINSANIANMTTTGYKRSEVSFQSILEKILNKGAPASLSSGLGGTNPLQMGQGMGIATTAIDFTQGSFVSSNTTVDIAINGIGLMTVSNDGGATYQYTRAGKFYMDSNGNLTTDKGMQVYGLNSSGALTAITGLTGSLSEYTWDDGTGTLLKNGASTGFRMALTYFTNSEGLEQASGTTFKETLASGSPSTPMAVGGAAGTIVSGQLEQSNVIYTSESVDSLEIQRAMSANLSTIKAASDMISQFISKLS